MPHNAIDLNDDEWYWFQVVLYARVCMYKFIVRFDYRLELIDKHSDIES